MPRVFTARIVRMAILFALLAISSTCLGGWEKELERRRTDEVPFAATLPHSFVVVDWRPLPAESDCAASIYVRLQAAYFNVTVSRAYSPYIRSQLMYVPAALAGRHYSFRAAAGFRLEFHVQVKPCYNWILYDHQYVSQGIERNVKENMVYLVTVTATEDRDTEVTVTELTMEQYKTALPAGVYVEGFLRDELQRLP